MKFLAHDTPKCGQLIAVMLLATLAGCAAQMNPIGEAKFDCNRRQDAKSPYCRSFKSVDAATTPELPESRFDKNFSISELDKLNGIAPDSSSPAEADKRGPAVATLLPHQRRSEPELTGAPVREGPVIQRVWIKRFVDGRDVLTENTVVYKEIKPTRWAGFDTKTISISDTKNYPRRPAEQTPASFQNQASQAQTPPAQRPPEFSQPNSSSSDASESATDPAANGFINSNSMPK